MVVADWEPIAVAAVEMYEKRQQRWIGRGDSSDGSREQGVGRRRVRAGKDVQERATARRGCA